MDPGRWASVLISVTRVEGVIEEFRVPSPNYRCTATENATDTVTIALGVRRAALLGCSHDRDLVVLLDVDDQTG